MTLGRNRRLTHRLAPLKFTLLLAALLLLVFAPMLVPGEPERRHLTGIAFLAILIFGVLAVLRDRRHSWGAVLLAVPATALHIVSMSRGDEFLLQWRVGILAAFVAITALLIARELLAAKSVTWDQIQGAICLYLLSGVFWGLLYLWIAARDSNAFDGIAAFDPAASDALIYFSFVTLTTLGYGDIVPLSQGARTLAWTEAAFGQILLVVLVARLVSLHLVRDASPPSQ